MIRKVGKYEILTTSESITRSNYWYSTFIIGLNDKSLIVKFPSYEMAIALYYAEDEASIDYCLSIYRATAKNWLTEIDTFLDIN